MNWRSTSEVIRLFADELKCNVDIRKIHTPGGMIEYYTFTDHNNFSYEFRHTKPYSLAGNRFQIQSAAGSRSYQITASVKLFFWPSLQIAHEPIEISLKEKLQKLQQEIGRFSWKSSDQLTFKTPKIDLNIETLRLIREVHLELKELE